MSETKTVAIEVDIPSITLHETEVDSYEIEKDFNKLCNIELINKIRHYMKDDSDGPPSKWKLQDCETYILLFCEDNFFELDPTYPVVAISQKALDKIFIRIGRNTKIAPAY